MVEIKEESEDENSNDEHQSEDHCSTGFEISLDMDVIQSAASDANVVQVTSNSTINATKDAKESANSITNKKSTNKKPFMKPKSILKRSRRCSTP